MLGAGGNGDGDTDAFLPARSAQCYDTAAGQDGGAGAAPSATGVPERMDR